VITHDMRSEERSHTTIKSFATMISPLKYFSAGVRHVSSVNFAVVKFWKFYRRRVHGHDMSRHTRMVSREPREDRDQKSCSRPPLQGRSEDLKPGAGWVGRFATDPGRACAPSLVAQLIWNEQYRLRTLLQLLTAVIARSLR
jgi:hypothetical protein